MSDNIELSKQLEKIRKEIPIALRAQAKEIGISLSTLASLGKETKELKTATVRAIKAYIANYNS